jgi:hypothetical protein
MQRVLAHSGALLIGGRSFAAEVHERLGTPLARFTIVPGAVIPPDSVPARRPRTAVRSGCSTMAGSIAGKGVLDFVNALACLPAEGWTATVSGIGPDFDTARTLPTSSARRVRAHRLCRLRRRSRALPRPRALVSPTYAEGFSNTSWKPWRAAMRSCPAAPSASPIVCATRHGLLVEPGTCLPSPPPDPPDPATSRSAPVSPPPRWWRRAAPTALGGCGARIISQYARLLGTAPDNDFDPNIAIEPCRFRAEPHLL